MNIQEENLASDSVDKEIDSQMYFNEGKSLSERLQHIKKMLRTESHLWDLLDDKGSVSGHRIKIYFERKLKFKNDNLVTYTFVGNTMHEAVADAERYITQELAAGTIVDYAKK